MFKDMAAEAVYRDSQLDLEETRKGVKIANTRATTGKGRGRGGEGGRRRTWGSDERDITLFQSFFF